MEVTEEELDEDLKNVGEGVDPYDDDLDPNRELPEYQELLERVKRNLKSNHQIIALCYKKPGEEYVNPIWMGRSKDKDGSKKDVKLIEDWVFDNFETAYLAVCKIASEKSENDMFIDVPIGDRQKQTN